MPLKITGVRSLQNKLARMASELNYDRQRLQIEYPDMNLLALTLCNAIVELERTRDECNLHGTAK